MRYTSTVWQLCHIIIIALAVSAEASSEASSKTCARGKDSDSSALLQKTINIHHTFAEQPNSMKELLQRETQSSGAATQLRGQHATGVPELDTMRYPSRLYWHLPSNGTNTHALRLDAHGNWVLRKQVTQDSNYVKCVKHDKDSHLCNTSIATEETPLLFGKRLRPLQVPSKQLEISSCNPSLILLPTTVQRMHEGGRYLAVMRANIQCPRSILESSNFSHGHGTTRRRNSGLIFAVLDSDLGILDEGRVKFRDNVTDPSLDGQMMDPRLFWYGNQPMLAFSNFGYSHYTDYSKQFLAPLRFEFDSEAMSTFISGAEARVIEICDGDLKGTGAKNLGFFVHSDIPHAINWISPTYVGRFAIDAETGVASDDGFGSNVPLHRTCFQNVSMVSNITVSSNPQTIHNGPGLVYIPSRDEYLGIGHRGLGSSPRYAAESDISSVVDISDNMHIDSNAKWPHHYTMFFYTVEARPPFKVTHVGHEFCIGVEDCEVIQMATSLTVDGETVLLGYGVNDCESFVAKLSMTMIFEMLHSV